MNMTLHETRDLAAVGGGAVTAVFNHIEGALRLVWVAADDVWDSGEHIIDTVMFQNVQDTGITHCARLFWTRTGDVGYRTVSPCAARQPVASHIFNSLNAAAAFMADVRRWYSDPVHGLWAELAGEPTN